MCVCIAVQLKRVTMTNSIHVHYTVKTRRRSESAYIRQVHDNVIMYTSTRLHTRLPSNVRAQQTIMTSLLHARCAVACAENPSEMVLHFCKFLLNPHFYLEPDYIFRKPIKRRFQRYIVRTEIFSTFQYVIPSIQTNGTECAQTHTHRHTKVKT